MPLSLRPACSAPRRASGSVTATTLIALMAELGRLTRRARRCRVLRRSTMTRGDPATSGTSAAAGVRRALYMTAITAACSNSCFKLLNQAMRAKGKPAKVALIASSQADCDAQCHAPRQNRIPALNGNTVADSSMPSPPSGGAGRPNVWAALSSHCNFAEVPHGRGQGRVR
jgi:hypothetical protein